STSAGRAARVTPCVNGKLRNTRHGNISSSNHGLLGMRRAVGRKGRLRSLFPTYSLRPISRRNEAASLVSVRRLRGRATLRRLLLGTRSRRHGNDLSRGGQSVASEGRSESHRGASSSDQSRGTSRTRTLFALRPRRCRAPTSKRCCFLPFRRFPRWQSLLLCNGVGRGRNFGSSRTKGRSA